MRQYLKYFDIAADQAGATKHLSGPHTSREEAPIPPPAVKADSNEAS